MARSQRPWRLVMKMDTEGMELALLPHLLRTFAACALDQIFVEWHAHFFKPGVIATAAHELSLPRELISNAHAVQNLVESERKAIEAAFNRSSEACPARLVELDDETYAHDGREWPASNAICSSRPQGTAATTRGHAAPGSSPDHPHNHTRTDFTSTADSSMHPTPLS